MMQLIVASVWSSALWFMSKASRTEQLADGESRSGVRRGTEGRNKHLLAKRARRGSALGLSLSRLPADH